MITRRKLVIAIGAGALAPLASFAQQREKLRRLGVLMGYTENDPEAQLRFAAFKERLAALGWREGRNLKIDVLWAAADVARASAYAKELVALQPEVILANTTPVTRKAKMKGSDENMFLPPDEVAKRGRAKGKLKE